ncbi:MAG: cyclic nucleotide-binding domain-containing protein [Gemmatimonadota bacterium]|nr:cyclic nucleotide-binding domain-containing protein [Gemmatimonadota bacterium]MDH5805593.1 cyclic nucleotide-binding domain-containing protein [Gemmatimonadota bacterium]
MDVNLLKQTQIFADLEEDELKLVAEICKENTFKFGQTIFKEGEKGNRLYIIAQGAVRISRNVPGSGEEALTVLKPGAVFGEMAVLDRSERSTDAIANVDSVLYTISRPDLEMLLDFHRELAYKVLWSIVKLLCERLRITNDNLKSFLAMSMF